MKSASFFSPPAAALDALDSFSPSPAPNSTAIPPAELQAWIPLRHPLRQIVLLSRRPSSKRGFHCAISSAASLEQLLLAAPLPHFHKIDEAIHELTAKRDASSGMHAQSLYASQVNAKVNEFHDCKPSLKEPDLEKSPDRSVKFNLSDLYGTADTGSQTEIDAVTHDSQGFNMIGVTNTADMVSQTDVHSVAFSCQVDSSIIIAEVAIPGPEVAHRDEWTAKVDAHQTRYPGRMLLYELRSFSE